MRKYLRKANGYAKPINSHPDYRIKITKGTSSMSKNFLTLGAINAFICVALGAFGAHGLKQSLSSDMLVIFQYGVQYHFYHSMGLILVGLVLLHFSKSRLIEASGWLMLMGIILFCGSLYILSLTETRSLGMIAPIGGLSFLSAWALLAYGTWKAN